MRDHRLRAKQRRRLGMPRDIARDRDKDTKQRLPDRFLECLWGRFKSQVQDRNKKRRNSKTFFTIFFNLT